MIKTDKFKKDDVLLIADFGRSAQGWLSYILSYVLNARYIEPYNLLSGSKYSKSNIIEKKPLVKCLKKNSYFKFMISR